MSQLGWIDFSGTHRNRVMLVMDMFKDQGVIDELGIGTIRDSLSDIFFPGTSTIQTRAKYFILIPWIIQDIEKRGRIEQFNSELEQLEIDLVKTLRQKGDTEGIIGATLPNANPKRKPSSIYWNGLRTYEILDFRGSLSEYGRLLKHLQKERKKQRRLVVEGDGNTPGDDKDANHLYQKHYWCQLPIPPENWKTETTIRLNKSEATFLMERIIRSKPQSLWAYILRNCMSESLQFRKIDDFLSIPQLPEDLRTQIILASDFNVIMQGALIRYNLLIQNNREGGRSEELIPAWNAYLERMKSYDWNSWDIEFLWKHCPFTPPKTKLFVQKWIECVLSGNYNETIGDKLIKDREFSLKGARRSRLYDKAIAQKQQGFTAIGVDGENVNYLTYRWNNVKVFIKDIQEGLEN